MPPAHRCKHPKKLFSISQGNKWIFPLCKWILSFAWIASWKTGFLFTQCIGSFFFFALQIYYTSTSIRLLTTVLEPLTETPEKQTVKASHPTKNLELSKLVQMVQKFPSKIGNNFKFLKKWTIWLEIPRGKSNGFETPGEFFIIWTVPSTVLAFRGSEWPNAIQFLLTENWRSHLGECIGWVLIFNPELQ